MKSFFSITVLFCSLLCLAEPVVLQKVLSAYVPKPGKASAVLGENGGVKFSGEVKYADKFGIHGGICVQSAIGILPREELEAEIRRVFSVLRGKRWVCNTSHYVQNHCTMEDLIFAFDLIYKLARE